jgi:long-chain acyl-CoA synthetase
MSQSTVHDDLSAIENRPANVGRQFFDRVQSSPNREAYRFPKGDEWESVTWKETGDRVSKLAAGLVALGIELEQRVGIASTTRFEWILADLAIMCAGGATTTVYPSTIDEDVAYILADSECRVVFAEDDEQIAKLTAHRSELPHLVKVVTFEGTTDGDWVIDLAELERLGEELLAKEPDAV